MEKEAEEEERNASIGEFRDGAKDEINLLPPASFRPVVGPGGGVRAGGCARLRGELTSLQGTSRQLRSHDGEEVQAGKYTPVPYTSRDTCSTCVTFLFRQYLTVPNAMESACSPNALLFDQAL
jgi:hypothetical protein